MRLHLCYVGDDAVTKSCPLCGHDFTVPADNVFCPFCGESKAHPIQASPEDYEEVVDDRQALLQAFLSSSALLAS